MSKSALTLQVSNIEISEEIGILEIEICTLSGALHMRVTPKGPCYFATDF